MSRHLNHYLDHAKNLEIYSRDNRKNMVVIVDTWSNDRFINKPDGFWSTNFPGSSYKLLQNGNGIFNYVNVIQEH